MDTQERARRASVAEHIRQAEQAAREGVTSGLFEAIRHGDDEHKAWLKQAIEDFCAGRPVKRSCGKGSVEAAREKALEEIARYADAWSGPGAEDIARKARALKDKP